MHTNVLDITGHECDNYEAGKKLDKIEKKVDGKAVKHDVVSKNYAFIMQIHIHSFLLSTKHAQYNVAQNMWYGAHKKLQCNFCSPHFFRLHSWLCRRKSGNSNALSWSSLKIIFHKPK